MAYLGHYTHRIAISNERIVSIDGDDVTFRYKDRADGDQRKLMTLPAGAFLRRFLLHVLPKGFVRIRHSDCSRTPSAGTGSPFAESSSASARRSRRRPLTRAGRSFSCGSPART